MKNCVLHRIGGTVAVMFFLLAASASFAEELSVLFLGDNGPHQPRARFHQLQPVLDQRGIQVTYTEDGTDLNSHTLASYDALLLYANIDRITPEQEKALLDYVEAGGGFVPLHCATYCFRNSQDVVALMGAQFRRHATGVFRTEITQPNHPIMDRFGGFESWDETYVHHRHNDKDRVVLAYRVDENGREPWTWVRTHGKGRVFYTAWGHDHRTWGNPGFHNLVERGIRWAAGRDPGDAADFLVDRAFPVPEMTPMRTDVEPFAYVDVGRKIPNYTRSRTWGTQGEPLHMMQMPLPPEESLKHIVVPQGFHVELFVSENDLGGKPICMAWDERGRLWVAETYDYPNQLQPPGEGRDRIRICEDTDGDWKADRFTVFAEKLSIPTSITFYRGGAIVHSGTETLYLKDTDGDDRADQRRVMFSNWTMRDTHGGVSNFQYGLDNWIWAMQGYNDSQPVVNGTRQQAFRMGFFRFRPDGSEIEFLRSTDNNTWGLGISEEGIVFGSTANRNPSVYMPIPNRYYERVRGWTPSLVLETIADTFLFKPITDKVRQVDHFGGYTAGAGHALYTARQYPREYWNRTAFVNGPTGHLVGTFVLKPRGADFSSSSPFNLLASDDEWAAPIMSEVGPDGNVWVLDWHNFIVQHNPTPRGFKTGKGNAYESDLRDKKHGRVYRVVYDAADEAKPFSLADATVQELVATLVHPTLLWRRHAQRLLVQRGQQDVVPALIKLVQDTSVDQINLNVGAIHALWTLHGLGALDGRNRDVTAAAVGALDHPSPGVRRNAVQVLPPTSESVAAVLSAGLLRDPDAQVRLLTFLALADLPPTDVAGKAILAALVRPENLNDRWIPDAATSAAANHSRPFLQGLTGIQQPPTKLIEIAGVVSEHYARSGPAESAVSLIAGLKKAPPPMANEVVRGISRGWPAKRKAKLNAAQEADFEELLSRLEPGNRGLLAKLASDWGSEKFQMYFQQVVADLLAKLDDTSATEQTRIEAVQQLVEFQPHSAALVRELVNRISPQLPPAVAVGLVRALQLSESSETGKLLIDRFAALTPAARQAGITVLLARPGSTRALLDGVDKGAVQLSELSLDQKQALARYPDRRLRLRARRLLDQGGALPRADRQKVLDELVEVTRQRGDVVNGKLVFKNQCSKCHVHSGEGTPIGPDLTGMAVHSKEELLTRILAPSRSVEGNFRVYTLVTTDGQVLSGMLASESKTTVELFDAEGKRQTVLRDNIEELIASSKSLMPEGFEQQIKPHEFADLLEFLSRRGRYLPVDLGKVATMASDRGMFNNRGARAERLVFSSWSPTEFRGVPFRLIDPRGGKVANVVLLRGRGRTLTETMPSSVEIPCNGPVVAIHLLSGVSGWGYPGGTTGSVSMLVRLHYADGSTEDHSLKNGVHFADYIRRVDVPESEFAFALRGRQMRYLAIQPQRVDAVIERIEFIKGEDRTAPVVMAVTLESPLE